MTRAHGYDISKWAGDWTPKKEVDFVILRASYGTQSGVVTDQKWHVNKTILANMDVVRGAYHYQSSHRDWREQADHFLELIQDQPLHVIAIDFEGLYNENTKSFAMGTIEALKYVKQQSGLYTYLYSGVPILQHWMMPYTQEWRNWPLWVAQYPLPILTEPPQVQQPAYLDRIENPAWEIWQYSADKNGMGSTYGVTSSGIDLNVYNGTIEDMKRKIGMTDDPTPTPEPNPHIEVLREHKRVLLKEIEHREHTIEAIDALIDSVPDNPPSPAPSVRYDIIATPYLNIRELPSLSSSKVGAIYPGTSVMVSEVIPIDNIKWGRIPQGYIALSIGDTIYARKAD